VVVGVCRRALRVRAQSVPQASSAHACQRHWSTRRAHHQSRMYYSCNLLEARVPRDTVASATGHLLHASDWLASACCALGTYRPAVSKHQGCWLWQLWRGLLGVTQQQTAQPGCHRRYKRCCANPPSNNTHSGRSNDIRKNLGSQPASCSAQVSRSKIKQHGSNHQPTQPPSPAQAQAHAHAHAFETARPPVVSVASLCCAPGSSPALVNTPH
jgi:hypothetical protein